MSKRYNTDILKAQLKIDKQLHTKIKSINHKISRSNNISFILLFNFFLILFFPNLSKGYKF